MALILTIAGGEQLPASMAFGLHLTPPHPLLLLATVAMRLFALSNMEECFEAVKSKLWTSSRLYIIQVAKLKVYHVYSFVENKSHEVMCNHRVVHISAVSTWKDFQTREVGIVAHSYIILALSNLEENIAYIVTETQHSIWIFFKFWIRAASGSYPWKDFNIKHVLWGDKEAYQTTRSLTLWKRRLLFGESLVLYLLVFLLLSRLLRVVSRPEAWLVRVEMGKK